MDNLICCFINCFDDATYSDDMGNLYCDTCAELAIETGYVVDESELILLTDQNLK